MLLLLIHDDQADILKRGEYRRPGADRNGRLPCPHPFPLIHALADRQPAVKDRNPIPKPRVKQPKGLRRKGNTLGTITMIAFPRWTIALPSA